MSKNIVVISGPSGCGKSTLIHRFLKNHKEVGFSISYTTRRQRQGEIDGKDYYFVDRDDFLRMRDDDQFVEWAEVHHNLYGTSRQEVVTKAGHYQVVVLDVDVQGAKQIKNHFPEALFILISPPDMKELERRLLSREKPLNGKDDPTIRQRLDVACQELKQFQMYNYIVVNDDLEKALHVLDSIYTAFLNSTAAQAYYVEKLLGEGV